MEGLPEVKGVTLAAGVLKPVLWGVIRGVGNRPRAGAGLPDPKVDDGQGSKTFGAKYFVIGVLSLELEQNVWEEGSIYDSEGPVRIAVDLLREGSMPPILPRSGSSFSTIDFQHSACSGVARLLGASGSGPSLGVYLSTISVHR